MATSIFPSLIGRSLKDENGREVGKIVSFIMDPLGETKEALVETKGGSIVRFPIERLRVNQEEISLTSDIERRADKICKNFPILLKKREILDSLFKNKEIIPEIYETLSAGFNKSLDELRSEAKNLLSDIEQQIRFQEDLIKTLHLARTFLEIEHGVGNVKDDVFRQSLLSILREIKYASHKKINLLKIKDMISKVSFQELEEKVRSEEPSLIAREHADNEKSVINVRITAEEKTAL